MTGFQDRQKTVRGRCRDTCNRSDLDEAHAVGSVRDDFQEIDCP
jgi:hypothetical protein